MAGKRTRDLLMDSSNDYHYSLDTPHLWAPFISVLPRVSWETRGHNRRGGGDPYPLCFLSAGLRLPGFSFLLDHFLASKFPVLLSWRIIPLWHIGYSSKFLCQIHHWPQLINRPSVSITHLFQKAVGGVFLCICVCVGNKRHTHPSFFRYIDIYW